MLVVSGSTIRSTSGWPATHATRDFARQSICRMSRCDTCSRHRQNKSGGSLRSHSQLLNSHQRPSGAVHLACEILEPLDRPGLRYALQPRPPWLGVHVGYITAPGRRPVSRARSAVSAGGRAIGIRYRRGCPAARGTRGVTLVSPAADFCRRPVEQAAMYQQPGRLRRGSSSRRPRTVPHPRRHELPV